MTLTGINEMMQSLAESLEVPYTYFAFKETDEVNLPYILFYYPASDDLYADGTNFVRITELDIEFYSQNKDFEKEKAIEEFLISSGMAFAKSEAYLDSENCFETIYTMEVLINGNS